MSDSSDKSLKDTIQKEVREIIEKKGIEIAKDVIVSGNVDLDKNALREGKTRVDKVEVTIKVNPDRIFE